MAPRKISTFEEEYRERSNRRRFAWAQYGAYVGQQNLNRQCENLRRNLSQQRCSPSEIKEKVKIFREKKTPHNVFIA